MKTGSEFLLVPEIVKGFVLGKFRGAPVKKVTLYIINLSILQLEDQILTFWPGQRQIIEGEIGSVSKLIPYTFINLKQTKYFFYKK